MSNMENTIEKQLSVVPNSPLTTEEKTFANVVSEAPEKIPIEKKSVKLEQPPVEEGKTVTQEPETVDGSSTEISPLNLHNHHIQPEALKLIPEELVRKYNVIPLAINDNTLQVAMVDINDILTLQVLATRTRMRIEPVAAAAEDIQKPLTVVMKTMMKLRTKYQNGC